jgi:hypothetical protein
MPHAGDDLASAAAHARDAIFAAGGSLKDAAHETIMKPVENTLIKPVSTWAVYSCFLLCLTAQVNLWLHYKYTSWVSGQQDGKLVVALASRVNVNLLFAYDDPSQPEFVLLL